MYLKHGHRDAGALVARPGILGDHQRVAERRPGATRYRLLLPESFESTVGALYKQLKDRHNATLIGYRAKDQNQPTINPANHTPVRGGELFYIAEARLAGLDSAS